MVFRAKGGRSVVSNRVSRMLPHPPRGINNDYSITGLFFLAEEH